MSHITEQLLDIYGLSSTSKANAPLEGLFIKGDFPALDFTEWTVINSRFQSYHRLLSSRFAKSKFLFTGFENCGDPNVTTTTLDQSMIDASCDLGDLRAVLDLTRSGKREEAKMVEEEAKKFLPSSFKGNRFIDNNLEHIRFSSKVPGLANNKFDRIIAHGYVDIKREKKIGAFYEIAESFRPSARHLLTDNYPDATMKRFLAFIRA
ncbi:MAG: hypothetical protein ACTS6J_05950 [Burkholderiales bacterium]